MESESTVGEVARFRNSLRKPVTSSKREPGPYPYYGAAAIQDWVNNFLFEGLHVLVGEDGTVQTPEGRPLVQLVDGKFWVNNHAHVLVCDSDSDTRFLAYALSEVQVAPYVTGAAQPKLNMGNLKGIPIRWPSEERRRKIAEIGKAFDDRIETLRQTSATLEAIAQALFKSWFVDFDPVRAKAEGREPEGMDPATAALFPSEFEHSELGPIPKGWQVRSLDSIAHYLNGLALQKYPPESEIEYLPVIKIAQLRAGNTRSSDRASAHLKPEYIVEDGDVLFSWSGSLEVEVWSGGRGALNQHLFKVTSNEVPKWFYYLATRQHLPSFREIAAHKATTMGHIQRRHLAEAKVALPPADILEKLSTICEPLFERRVANSLQAKALSSTRDTLLPRLISGKLCLPK